MSEFGITPEKMGLSKREQARDIENKMRDLYKTMMSELSDKERNELMNQSIKGQIEEEKEFNHSPKEQQLGAIGLSEEEYYKWIGGDVEQMNQRLVSEDDAWTLINTYGKYLGGDKSKMPAEFQKIDSKTIVEGLDEEATLIMKAPSGHPSCTIFRNLFPSPNLLAGSIDDIVKSSKTEEDLNSQIKEYYNDLLNSQDTLIKQKRILQMAEKEIEEKYFFNPLSNKRQALLIEEVGLRGQVHAVTQRGLLYSVKSLIDSVDSNILWVTSRIFNRIPAKFLNK